MTGDLSKKIAYTILLKMRLNKKKVLLVITVLQFCKQLLYVSIKHFNIFS